MGKREHGTDSLPDNPNALLGANVNPTGICDWMKQGNRHEYRLVNRSVSIR